MAIYHLTVKHGSRTGGQSAVAKRAYITREEDHARRAGFAASESGNIPSWAEDAREFWQAADDWSRANARLFTEVEAALPRELDRDQQVELVREFASSLAARDGGQVPYTWAIHDDGKGNPHVHLMLSSKVDDGRERPDAKTWFSRAATGKKAIEAGGVRSWSEATGKEWLEATRELWAKRTNHALEKASVDQSIDHRSHARRGKQQVPTVHVGWTPRRAAEARAFNAEVRQLNRQLRDAARAIKARLAQLNELAHTVASKVVNAVQPTRQAQVEALNERLAEIARTTGKAMAKGDGPARQYSGQALLVERQLGVLVINHGRDLVAVAAGAEALAKIEEGKLVVARSDQAGRWSVELHPRQLELERRLQGQPGPSLGR